MSIEEHPPVNLLLIDDQEIVAEAIRQMVSDCADIHFFYCKDPSLAIAFAAEMKPTVILQDLVMPSMSGLELVTQFKANASTKDVPMIVLSTKEEPKVKAEAFALGANDYLVKLPDKVELVARIRYHSQGFVRLLERNLVYQKLQESQRELNQELAEAAAYVESLLPKPLESPIRTRWCFIPSTMLGGDIFGYHWLDEDHFVLFLLDVCGHGVGAALLSISVMNTLRSQTLSGANFYDPSSVLSALNHAFQMENHNNMFFTIWYGVYNRKTQEMLFATGGHPPAIMLSKTQEKVTLLKGTGMVIGGMPEILVVNERCHIEEGSILYLFSDGVYEVERGDKTLFKFEEFMEILQKAPKSPLVDLSTIVAKMREIHTKDTFADDFSIVQVAF